MDGISGILGIDCGAVAVGMAVVSPDLAIVRTAYRFHRGDIKRTVLEMLNGIDLSTISHVAVTASVPGYVMAQRRYDNQVAFMTACRHLHPGMRGLLLVGGEKYLLRCRYRQLPRPAGGKAQPGRNRGVEPKSRGQLR